MAVLYKLCMEATIQKTASVLSGRGGPNSPSKGFQLLVRAIGEAKTKHVTADHDHNSGGVANHLTMTNLLERNFHSLFNMSSIKIPYHLNTSSTHSLTHHMYPHTLTLSLLQEEDRIMRKEALLLKEKMGSRDTTTVSRQYTHTYTHTHIHTHTHSHIQNTHSHTLTHTLTHTHTLCTR